MWNHYLFHHDQVFSNRSTLRITQTNRPCQPPTTTTPTPPPLRPTLEFSNKQTIVTRQNFRAVDLHPPTQPALLLPRCNSVHFRFQMLVPEIAVRPSTSVATSLPSFKIGVNIFKRKTKKFAQPFKTKKLRVISQQKVVARNQVPNCTLYFRQHIGSFFWKKNFQRILLCFDSFRSFLVIRSV